jgi:hypothetical protein
MGADSRTAISTTWRSVPYSERHDVAGATGSDKPAERALIVLEVLDVDDMEDSTAPCRSAYACVFIIAQIAPRPDSKRLH